MLLNNQWVSPMGNNNLKEINNNNIDYYIKILDRQDLYC